MWRIALGGKHRCRYASCILQAKDLNMWTRGTVDLNVCPDPSLLTWSRRDDSASTFGVDAAEQWL
jgi:hypothetical protein